MPRIYHIHKPPLVTAGVYFFTTDKGIDYEVRFGRKQHSLLTVSIVFGVLNEEYDGEEYVLTNKGEFFSVMATIGRVIEIFLEDNPKVYSLEFAGEPSRKEQNSVGPTKRTMVYMRYARKSFPEPFWEIRQEGNRVFIEKR